MAKKIYIGVGGTARKVKKIYIGVGGVARRVKKAYIGVGGVARCFWSGGEPVYYGKLTASELCAGYISAEHVGNYAVFAGGRRVGDDTDDYSLAINASLTKSTPGKLNQRARWISTVELGSYALFAGGYDGDYNLTTVTAYNTSLTKSTPTALTIARANSAGATVGSYGLFVGGNGAGNRVDIYNTSLTLSSKSDVSARYYNAGASVGNYALFAGGETKNNTYGYPSNTVYAYNASLTQSLPTALSVARGGMAGASVGNYALFAGGATNVSAYRSEVDAYNASLTRSTPAALDTTKAYGGATTLGDYALFFWMDGTVDMYDTSLTRTAGTDLSSGVNVQRTTVTVGDYALTGETTIHIYTI